MTFMRLPFLLFFLFALAHCAPQSHGNLTPSSPEPLSIAVPSPGESESSAPEQRPRTSSDERQGEFTTRQGCYRNPVASPQWWHTRVGYQIFVRSFRDSDGDGTGDLEGLQSRLNYLSDEEEGLGADLVWLMPILQSPSYHGYDVEDYRAVDDEYGSETELSNILEEAEKQDIRLIMDLVLNHTSDAHPWFLSDAMETGEEAQERYVWSPTQLDWTQPWSSNSTWHGKAGRWFYGLFSPSMPDLNFANDEVKQELLDISVHWVDAGLTGYRLDAVRYLIETGSGSGQKDTEATHAFWQRLRSTLPAGTLLVGEAWAELDVAATYFGSSEKPELPMLFDFDGATAMLKAAESGDGKALQKTWCDRWEKTPLHGTWGTFLTNHDQDRVGTVLKGNEQKMRTAAALLLLGPDVPWIYYGEEIGAENGKSWGDMGRREPLNWGDAWGGFTSADEPWTGPASPPEENSISSQQTDPESLWSWYRSLIQTRSMHPALQIGSSEVLTEFEGIGLVRHHDNESCIVLVPLQESHESFSFSSPNDLSSWIPVLSDGGMSYANGKMEGNCPLGTACVYCSPPLLP